MNKIADELLSFIINAFTADGVSKLMEENKKNKLDKLCKDIEYRINEEINKKYESEIYFDGISRFFKTNNVVVNIFSSILNITSEDSIEAILIKYTNNFVESFPEFLVYKNDVRIILESVYSITKTEVNKSKIIENEKEILYYIIEYSKRGNENLKEILDRTAIMSEQIYSINEKISDIDNKINLTATIDNVTNDIRLGGEFSVEFKTIEDNYQKKYLFKEAIEEYMLLLSDILAAGGKNNEVLGAIYLNLTLCTTNLKRYELANKHILNAEKYCNTNDAGFYYTYGYLLWKNDNLNEALLKLDIAIKSNYKHYSARLLRCILLAQKGYDLSDILLDLDNIKSDIPKSDNDKIAEYYRTRGTVYKFFDYFEEAIEYTKKSEELVNDIINKFNIGIIYYNWALKDNLQDGKRKLKIKADYEKLLKALDIFKKILNQDNIQIEPYRDELMSFYVSSCEICYKFENIDSIKLSDTFNLDYEIVRSVIIHKIINGDISLINGLSASDRQFYELCELANKDIDFALEKIEKIIDDIHKEEYYRYYNLYLELLLIKKDTEKYKRIRTKLEVYNISNPYLELYDAKYNEICGDIKAAKKYYDDKLNSFDDEKFLDQAIHFYEINNFNKELINIYEIGVNKIIEHTLVHHDIKRFMLFAFDKLTANNYENSLEIFNKLKIDEVGEEIYYNIQYNLYAKINYIDKMLMANRVLQKYKDTFNIKIDELIFLKQQMLFQEGIFKAKDIDENILNKDQKILLYELLSELYLLDGNNKESIEYIRRAKDEGKELVFDPVHNLYMNRSIRCGNEDGIKYGIEFKQKFPNTTEWIKSIAALKKDEYGNDVLTDDINDFLIKQNEKYSLFINFYRKKIITIYQISTLYSIDLFMAFNWHLHKVINLNVNFSNNEELDTEYNNLTSNVIIDSLTLLFLANYDLWDVLKIYNKIYITYSNVEEIENLFLMHDNEIIRSALLFLKNNLYIEFIPNYSMLSNNNFEHHPQYFVDSIIASEKMKTNFFCVDCITKKYFKSDYFISIVSIIHKFKNLEDKSTASEIIYKLKNSNLEFIGFDAYDLLYAYKKVNSFKDKSIKPYFNIKSSYDLKSFINVYISIIIIIEEEQLKEEVIYDYVETLLINLDKNYNRATNLKLQYNSLGNEDDKIKFSIFLRYVCTLLFSLIQEFKKNDKISQFIIDYPYKYISPSLIKTIKEKIADDSQR